MADLATGDIKFSTIPQLVDHAAVTWPDAAAIEEGDRRISFSELRVAVRRAARGLIAIGVAHGDTVGIWAPNCWEWVVAGLAVHAVGGAVVPLNTRYRGKEAAYILEKSRARVLFTVEGFLNTSYVSMLRDAAGGATSNGPVEGLPDLRAVVVMRGGEVPGGTLSWADLEDNGASIGDDELDRRAAAVSPDDTCDILFTSGTTGTPKGVVTTHAQNLRVYSAWSDIVGLTHGDRYLIVNPFFHAFGYKAGWLASLISGATVLPQSVFDVAECCRRIEAEKVTVFPGPPAVYQSILASGEHKRRDLSSLRLAVTGAASIPVVLIERMYSELKLSNVFTAYGLTECTGTVTMCRAGDSPETIAQTSGRAIPGVEVRIVDTAMNEVERGEPGEIVVRGYNVMKGYFDEPELSKEAISPDGWLLTGDVGVMDAQGNIRITDRMKDMFITGGFNAYPAEIESILATHPDVASAAVVGVPDERMGEVGVAFVVLAPGASADEAALTAWSRNAMANFKVPRRFFVVDDLPRNATGKVLKYELRERARHL